jgi:hypothetical protein
MSNDKLKQIIIAMMYASGLDPVLDDDFYQNLDGETIARFLEGICAYFKVQRDSWMVHFSNLAYMKTPSETITFFINNKSDLGNL